MNYETGNAVFPAAYLGNVNLSGTAYGITYPDDGWNGWPGFAWGTMILPYIEQSPLYASTNINLPCSAADNITSAVTKIAAFICPSVSTGGDVHLRSSGTRAAHPTLPRIRFHLTPAITLAQSHYATNAGRKRGVEPIAGLFLRLHRSGACQCERHDRIRRHQRPVLPELFAPGLPV